MKVGKLSGETLQQIVLSTITFQREDVLVHAGLGEDCAVIDFGDEVCLISSDPITGATEGIGELAVHVSCNDIAANGGAPLGVQVVLLLPEKTTESQIKEIMEDVHRTAARLNVEVLGGHTEITSKVTDCIVSVTAIGRAPKERYVTSAGAKIGDDIIVTKGAAIEGAAILARDFAHRFPFQLDSAEVNELTAALSVVPEGLIAAEFGVNAMHDVTEGGLLGAVRELCTASQVGAEIWEKDIHIPPLARKITDHLRLDPLALLSSGSMLITTAQGNELVARLAEDNIPAFIIGKITSGKHPVLVRANGVRKVISQHVEDELWKFLAAEGNN